MPKKMVKVNINTLSGEEKVGVLTALGSEREVNTVWMGEVGVEQLVGAADGLPTIRALDFDLTLPAGVQDAGGAVRTGLSLAIDQITHVRGLQCVTLTVDTTAEQYDSIEASIPDGANIGGFTIRHHQHFRGEYCTIMTAIRNA
mmetsp:Transcript_12249/g.29335  ORF Transcript_12249/g.29335 Transcript_12249/m.29335 type:complete len:144 (+) Transcript_12249:2-433(+)